MYQRIITYNFVHDETRGSFVEFLVGLGFEEQPDQSTYAQRNRVPRHLNELVSSITNWSHDVELSKEDSVQIYFLVHVDQNHKLIDRCDLNYSARYRDIR